MLRRWSLARYESARPGLGPGRTHTKEITHMTKHLHLLFVPLAALFLAAPPSAAQVNLLVPTTLASAVTSGSTRTIVVTSATNCIVGNIAYIESEATKIEAVNSTTLTAQRGASGTTGVAHPNGAYVVCGVPGAFAPTSFSKVGGAGNPIGSCTRASQLYLPLFNFKTGTVTDCLGGTWVSGSPFNSGTVTSTRFHVVSPDPGGTVYTSLNTSGTAVGATTLYCTEVFLPTNKLLTGIGVLNGTTVTGNARYVILYDSAGNALANSALAGQASVTASIYENYAFTAKFFAIGPQQYFGCFQDNAVGSTTVRMAVTQVNDNILTKGQTGATFGTVPALVVPTTFATAVGPYIYLF